MKHRWIVTVTLGMLLLTSLAWVVLGTDAEIYLASDKNGQNRVTEIQEGDEVYIVVYDPDENIDCDIRDKFWTDIKIMDPKTGAYIVWISYDDGEDAPPPPPYYDEFSYEPFKGHYPGDEGDLAYDYMEETGADTGLFVSKRAFKVGTRVAYNVEQGNTHVVDNAFRTDADHLGLTWDFQGGGFLYTAWGPAAATDGVREVFLDANGATLVATDLIWDAWHDTNLGFLPPFEGGEQIAADYLLGRFENMDTLVLMYQDQNDETDVAVGMAKINDHEATISWDQEIYKDANASATITVVDPDENINCNEIEYVPVFIIVNPGSWNPVNWDPDPAAPNMLPPSPNSFCLLKGTGGVTPAAAAIGTVRTAPIRWYNIYYSGLVEGAGFFWGVPGDGLDINNRQLQDDGQYFIQYPTTEQTFSNVVYYDTTDPWGFCRVSFYAEETGVNTGVFQLNINQILRDLGFNSLRVRDVLVAYYLDPNDEDDFKLATAYIEAWEHSLTTFTDAGRNDQEEYWLSDDSVYIQVIDANANVDPCCPEQVVVFVCDPHQEDDAEWLILDETSSNSPVFLTMAGTQLLPCWDALGVGLTDGMGGFQLAIDNWKLEAYNEDDIMVRYNDVYYESGADGLGGIGDISMGTAMPPQIDRIRVANDVSFDMMSIGDTQVYDGQVANMYFLDRQGNRVSGYVNSDCIFVEVIDPDQNEDSLRRERIDAFWDGAQNLPFGPFDLEVNHGVCGYWDNLGHPFNALLGDTNIFSGEGVALEGDEVFDIRDGLDESWAKLYVLNPRNGRWAAVDLMETQVASGIFRSVTCIDLVSVYTCTPSLGVAPGDTIVAVYQDPSNHSDSCWIPIKVGIGGGGTPATQASSTMFVDETGADVGSYTDADTIYVKVIDPSHAGAAALLDAVEIAGDTYDLEPLAGATSDTFITEGLALDLVAGEDITATYTDPTDPTDTSSDTVSIVASVLDVTGFTVTPNPFEDEVTFGYEGTGVAQVFQVDVYDVAGDLVWSAEEENVTEVMWDGAGAAKGAYIYIITVTDGTETFSGRDVFVKK